MIILARTAEPHEVGGAHVVGLDHARVVHHSPSGYEWGYGGSGPADLALNILHAFCLNHGGTNPSVKLYKGRTFKLAWRLHQRFKHDFLAAMPQEGGVIDWDAVSQWVKEKIQKGQAYG